MAWTKHKIPPIEKKWWCENPQEALDLLFAIVPITSSPIPIAIMIHVKTRQAIDSCLLGDAFLMSSVAQTLQPPRRLARTWAIARRHAAATPSTNASWLGSLHSNNHNRRCFSWFWAASALIPRMPAMASKATINKHAKIPNNLAIFSSTSSNFNPKNVCNF